MSKSLLLRLYGSASQQPTRVSKMAKAGGTSSTSTTPKIYMLYLQAAESMRLFSYSRPAFLGVADRHRSEANGPRATGNGRSYSARRRKGWKGGGEGGRGGHGVVSRNAPLGSSMEPFTASWRLQALKIPGCNPKRGPNPCLPFSACTSQRDSKQAAHVISLGGLPGPNAAAALVPSTTRSRFRDLIRRVVLLGSVGSPAARRCQSPRALVRGVA